MSCNKFSQYLAGAALIFNVGAALAAVDPFSEESNKEAQTENPQAQYLDVEVAGIMGINERMIAILKTADGAYRVVGKGDKLPRSELTVTRLNWKEVIVEGKGKIYKLDAPRASF